MKYSTVYAKGKNVFSNFISYVAHRTLHFAGGVTASVSPSIAIAGYETITNAPDIYALEGDGANVGGAGAGVVMGVPVYGSGDFVIVGDPNSTGKHYYGVTIAGGIGTPGAEGHAEISDTKTDVSINIYDVFAKDK